ncbi:MAG: thiocyanate hydrolase subunit gamma [Candidatus Thiodiazotropha sp.]|nr:thiocyanate hydrolase subunit gamma [Candidatus Thiodiazotropha taylori]MBT3057679.1 thiocyanate hydrolase subunit gamma [Candidatus Thiodiazotropha sp. (ex Lucina pensylvanica)]MBV2093964.1 thiocyanate hydrolase subunit gamma [Candidatus Thiodiazotropha sp. (ex Codakia orbicularis)]PUB72316.1 MAG: thiocyanate hydrolase subunit gamma [gamma proteobacterium symbiont of Ctena orbiculata]MBT3062561.1 thiocyanate hydrolase subunit gamma [Candidatus Thiodiazotropha sp. (ex Lucina pensylvanica)]
MAEKHKPAPMVEEVSEFEVLEIAVRELAIEKGLFTAEDHQRWTEYMHTLGPLPAARLVAKAWLDPEFKKLAVEDGVKASLEVGIDWVNSMPTQFGTPSDYCNLRVLEDTPKLKHVVVCTLCSCYPRPILGQSPEWYRTPNYRRRLVRWPRQVLAEFGLQLPDDVEVRVEDSNQKSRFIVLPVRPEGTEGWSEDQLAEIVTRDCLIGVAMPKPGQTANDPRPVRPAVNPYHH